MNRTYVVAAAVVLLVSLVGAFAYEMGSRQRALTMIPPGVTPANQAHGLPAELDDIRAAEKIEDPLQRCLAYPNPHEFNWDSKVVEALCKKKQWQMLTWRQIDEALNTHHPEIIDQAFDTYLATNYADPDKHGFLTWAFWWMFQSSSKWSDDTTQRWVEMDPASAYALAARGIHYSQAAYDARGGKAAGNTPAENFQKMREFVSKARADLEQSLIRKPRLIAAYHGLLRMSRIGAGDDDQRQKWVDAGLALDSADPWIYQDWIDAVEPQWGGSTSEMNDVAEAAARHADQNPLLATLRAEPLCNAGDQLRCGECLRDGAKALDLYRQAGAFGPSACFLEGGGVSAVLAEDSNTAVRYYSQAVRFIGTPDWLAYRAPALRSIGLNEWALQDLKNALAMNPQNTVALYSQGLSLEDMGRYGDAEKSYLAILNLDPSDQRTAIALSIMYLTPTKLNQPEKSRPLIAELLRRDPTLAHAWLLKAALSEINKDAPAYLVDAENYLKYVDHDDPSKKNDIEMIQGKLAEVRQILKRK